MKDNLKKENMKYAKIMANIIINILKETEMRKKRILDMKCPECKKTNETEKTDCASSKSFFKVIKDLYVEIINAESISKPIRNSAKELLSVFIIPNNEEIFESNYFT
jgi:phage FluMu protein Com